MADADLAALASIPDPLDRAEQANLAIPVVERIRNEAIAEASAAGISNAAIGTRLRLSRQRVQQILSGGPGPERAFWGADNGRLTAAFGRKEEAGRQPGSVGHVWAEEDTVAFDILDAGVRDYGITASRELIPPPGFVDLNRPGLVVICGPRLSPMVAQVLASDRALAFGCDGEGWYLEDHRAGRIWRSPMNAGENADIAYMGRLERPDRQGTFLYIAGIHADGAPGAVHYLTGNLEQVWQRVRDRRFSALVRCTFEHEPFRVTGSELLTDFYEGA